MKFLLSALMIFSFNAFAANSIIIDIGGVRHECLPMEMGNPAECYNTAYRGPFSKDESMQLCSGSYSDAPANCGISAYRGRFSKTESIQLCMGATSDNGPVDCANLAYNGPFSSTESIRLCSGNGSERTAVCALEAYRGPYSKEESIKMCKRSQFSDDSALRSSKHVISEKMSKEALNSLIEEANLKAFERKEYK